MTLEEWCLGFPSGEVAAVTFDHLTETWLYALHDGRRWAVNGVTKDGKENGFWWTPIPGTVAGRAWAARQEAK